MFYVFCCEHSKYGFMRFALCFSLDFIQRFNFSEVFHFLYLLSHTRNMRFFSALKDSKV